MALDSYSGLKTSIAKWTARDDLTTELDDFIDLFEAWINRNLRVPSMEFEADATASEYLALPSDFLELRDIQYQGSPRVELEYMTPIQADNFDTSGTTAIPSFYTIVGDQIRLIPAPSSTTATIRIAYWASITPLDGTNTSNWLLASHPDAYLYGSLFHARARIEDPQMATFVVTAWQQVMTELKQEGKRANLGSTLVTRPG